ncbi:MAG: TetR/AcrR family transcriptional regulator [Actinomycetota bacterium]|nr:TetR/AcrR family transcriptional regulator [Actinomycetota bacterium]
MQDLRTEPRQRRSTQSIGAILDAAERLIHEQGQVSFTAAELATEAKMSIGRVYYWFPDIPTIVSALVERTVERMVAVFQEELSTQRDTSTPLLVQRVVGSLCDHIDRNPGTVALSLTGGADSLGGALPRKLMQLVGEVVVDRVPGVPEAEVAIVSRTLVGIALGMLRDYTRIGDDKALLRQELVFVLSSWLYARYPSPDDPVWNQPQWLLQPSRPPRGGFVESGQVWPALAPSDPARAAGTPQA